MVSDWELGAEQHSFGKIWVDWLTCYPKKIKDASQQACLRVTGGLFVEYSAQLGIKTRHKRSISKLYSPHKGTGKGNKTCLKSFFPPLMTTKCRQSWVLGQPLRFQSIPLWRNTFLFFFSFFKITVRCLNKCQSPSHRLHKIKDLTFEEEKKKERSKCNRDWRTLKQALVQQWR